MVPGYHEATVDRERFEELVRQALATLPQEIAQRVDNVDVEVQDWPEPEQLASARVPRGRTLLGLYQGVPLTRRGSGYNMVSPDRIIIFQGPLERTARDDEDLVRRVRDVVVHEVAHHFGISDERLREIEAARSRARG
jgi:predicted Zn-dependent protease with MMP-like domain